MPELPEVENVVRVLRRELKGVRFGRVRSARRDVFHGDPRPPQELLPRRAVHSVERTGKRIELALSGGLRCYVHLGMTGQLAVFPRSDPPAPHTHLIVDLQNTDAQLRFRDVRRFGGIWLLDGAERHVGRPLPVARDDVLKIDWPGFRRVMQRDRQIKALLMDQHVLAGMGNIYCDEALFAAGIHPVRRAAAIPEDRARALHRAIRRILNAAIRAGGSTIRDYLGARNEPGRFQKAHRVYGRAGKPCTRCRTPLVRLIAAGRGTTICPACQPLRTGPAIRRAKSPRTRRSRAVPRG